MSRTPYFDQASTVAPEMTGVSRGVAFTSGGVVVLVMHNSGNGVRFYSNAGGLSLNLAVTFSDDILSGEYCSMTIDSTNHIHFVYTSVAGNVRYVKLTNNGSNVWTAGASELVRTKPANVIMGRKDIEVLDSGVIVISWLETDQTNLSSRVPTFRARVRHTGGAWGTMMTVTEPSVSSTSSARTCSVARDLAGAAGGFQNVAFSYQCVNTLAKFGTFRVALATGAIDQYTEQHTFGDSAQAMYGAVYSHAAGEYAFVGQQNHATGTNLSQTAFFRWKSGVGLTESADPLAQIDSTWPLASTTFPATAYVNGRGVLWTPFTLSDGSTLMARIYTPGVGWGPQFEFLSASATDYTYGVGVEFLRAGWNRNNMAGSPTENTMAVASVMARSDISTSTRRAHYYHTNGTAIENGAAIHNIGSGFVGPGTPVDGPNEDPIVLNDRPAMTVRSTLSPNSSGGWRVRGQWQIDSTNSFTGAQKTITAPISKLAFNGIYHNYSVDAANELSTGRWFIRARVLDELGMPGAWSTPVERFTISHPPSAVNESPTGGMLFPYVAGAVALSWVFSDPSPYCSQTAYRIKVLAESSGATIVDTGKVASTAGTANVTIPVGNKDMNLVWQVELWDSDDVVSTWVSQHLFMVGDIPVVSFVSPAAGAVINHPSLEVTWSTVFGGVRTQQAYKVDLMQGSTLIHSTGWTTSTATSYASIVGVMTNGQAYTVNLSVRDTGGLIGTATRNISAAWTAPTAPSFTVSTANFETTGGVAITWTNAGQDADFSMWRVYAREVGSSEWTFITDRPTHGTYTEYRVGSGVPWEYSVVQVADRFGSQVESTKSITTATATSSSYWLVPADSPQSLIRLYNVVSDDPAQEQDQEIHKLIGRGRKDDRGTHYGWQGSLVCQLWDQTGLTARMQRDMLQTARDEGRPYYLRNPFGDLQQVSFGPVSFTRMAGVGTREFCTVTLPYFEVA